MIGAPKIGVTAFNGKIPVEPGRVVTTLQISATTPPINIVVGKRDL